LNPWSPHSRTSAGGAIGYDALTGLFPLGFPLERLAGRHRRVAADLYLLRKGTNARNSREINYE
jgi:hypothetical protein